jgi:predicted alpha/beta superfamily hydrolase
MPQLNRHRRVWIYLPQSYSTSRKKYPVLYMHDGQNVFDEATSFAGEWGVDEALDTVENGEQECIVVAVDNGGDKRMNEYSPYDMERFGKGEGDRYVDFLVKTLKPYIDKKYRTKRNSRYRFIAGSSMGGLISFYAMIKYPKVFGGAGVFSPAFWIVPHLKEVMAQKAAKVKGKIYFYAGQQESASMVPDMLMVFEQMNRHSKAKMTSVIRSEGKHNEATWRHEFPKFYKWLLN